MTSLLTTLRWELADAARRLRMRPLPALAGLVVLTGGLAAFLFTLLLLNGIVLAKPPMAAPEELVTVHYGRSDQPRARVWIPNAEARDLLLRLTALAQVAAYTPATVAVRDQGLPVRVSGLLAGAPLLDVISVAPSLGRAFTAADDRAGAPLVVLLTDGLWRSRFAADPAVLGRPLWIDGREAVVIGVLPPHFEFQGAQVLLPARLDDPLMADETFMLIGRLAAGQGVAQVASQFAGYFAELPASRRGSGPSALQPRVLRLLEFVVNDNTRYFVGLMVACGAMVLLLALTNFVHLLLAEIAGRRHELATRVALGCTRVRLAAGLAIEVALLTLAATLLALACAEAGGRWLAAGLAAAGDPLPHWMKVGVDLRLALCAAVLAAAVVALAALLTSWRALRTTPEAALRGGGQVGARHGNARAAHLMTALQVAIACALLLSAAVCVQLLVATLEVDTGTRADPARVLSARVALPAGTTPAGAMARANAVRDRLAAEPGVLAAAVSDAYPGGTSRGAQVAIEGIDWGPDGSRVAGRAAVDSRFLDVLGIDLAAGRAFNGDDVIARRAVAIVDQDFVDAYLGGADPLGRRVTVNPGRPNARQYTIVGVTRPIHPWSPDDLPAPDLLLPFAAEQDRFFTLTVHTAADASALLARLPALVAEIDPEAPVFQIQTQAEAAAAGRHGIATVTQIIAGIALLGLVLALAGIYATLALGVARRTREIGLRRAIGASGAGIVATVARGGSGAVALGLVLGCAIGAPVAAGLAAQIENPGGFGLGLASMVVAALALASTLAMLVPVRRALQVEPMAALRQE